jgi:MoaA/NifB/PqqE/SkfB family radical SAM enzyme
VFADREYARKVVASGLDGLVFSIDGVTQATYEIFRRRGNLESVVRGIQNVIAEKRRMSSSTPVVNLRFIVMKHNEHELPLVKPFARELGVDMVTVRKFHFVPGTGPRGSAADLVPSETKYQLPVLVEGKEPVRAVRNSCRNLWNCPTIHWDGTVCTCFMDYRETRPLGSLAGQSFREIWFGDSYAELRKEFRRSWQTLPLCSDCASGYLGGDVGRQANAEALLF